MFPAANQFGELSDDLTHLPDCKIILTLLSILSINREMLD